MAHFYWRYGNQEIPFDPKHRKATSLMKLVTYGILELKKSLGTDENLLENADVYFCSLHGEIEPTLNFLKGIAERDLARPFLFQNSLHHSTTGFISQQHNVLGPCYSLCAVEDPQKEILQTGKMMSRHSGRPILFIHGESFPEELSELSEYSVSASCEFIYLDQSSSEKFSQMDFPKNFEELNSQLEASK